MTAATNIETKARCDDLGAAAASATELGATFASALTQKDTYFGVDTGRLKLRVVEERWTDGATDTHAELIRYQRPDEDGPRVSQYTIEPIANPDATVERLAAAHGLRAIVTKKRDLWLLGSTRIHLDRVDELGDFIELETVFDGRSDEVLWAEHQRIAAALRLSERCCVAGSYIDLLERSQASAEGQIADVVERAK